MDFIHIYAAMRNMLTGLRAHSLRKEERAGGRKPNPIGIFP